MAQRGKDPCWSRCSSRAGTTSQHGFRSMTRCTRQPPAADPRHQILNSTKNYGFHPAMAPLKKVWDPGKLAIVHGVATAKLASLALPFDGHLAYVASPEKGRDPGLVGSGGARNTTPERRTWSRS